MDDAQVFYIATGADDGYADSLGNFVTNDVVFLGNSGGTTYTNYLRFYDVRIPQYSVIKTAYISIIGRLSDSATTCNLKIELNAVDNAAQPTTAGEVTGMDVTSSVNWDNLGSWVNGGEYISPSLVTQVQEIVDRAGWVQNNYITVRISDNSSSADAHRAGRQRDSYTGATLYVEWGDAPVPKTIDAALQFSPEILVKAHKVVPISDWEEIHEALEMNGQDGRYLPAVPHSMVYVEELSITTGGTLYWNDFTPSNVDYNHGAGLQFFPRFFPYLFKGLSGDITANFRFELGMSGVIKKNPSITASFPFSPRIAPKIAYCGELNLGFDMLYRPLIVPNVQGLVETHGMLETYNPVKTIAFEGMISENGVLAFTLPLASLSLNGYRDVAGILAVNLGKKFVGSGYINENGDISLSIPRYVFSLNGSVSVNGILNLSIPLQRSIFSVFHSTEGYIEVTIPLIKLAFAMLPSTSPTMVLNIKNRALTLYDNYDFNSMCRFNGKHFGAAAGGIYDLDEGTDDDGVPIEWNITTGYLDLEQVFKKRLRQAWLSYKSNGDILVTVLLPSGEEYEYQLDGVYTSDTGLRVKFGKGIKTKYFSLGIKNVDGADIELDELKIHFEKIDKTR